MHFTVVLYVYESFELYFFIFLKGACFDEENESIYTKYGQNDVYVNEYKDI